MAGLIVLVSASAAVSCERGGADDPTGSPVTSASPATGVGAGAEAGEAGGDSTSEPVQEDPAWLRAALEEAPALVKAPAVQLDPKLAGACPSKKEKDRGVGVLTSPRTPSVGQPMRIWAADLSTTAPLAMRIEAEDGTVLETSPQSYEGVPARTVLRFEAPAPGKYTVIVGRDERGLRCREFWVAKFAKKVQPPSTNLEHVWRVRRRWDAGEEALYSAWVAELFEGEPQEALAWDSLHAVTGDVERNLLFNHQGWEDKSDFALELTPDCADLPYFLRAYYAWKRRLPFGFHRCSRGKPGQAPRCFSSWSVDETPELAPKWASGEEPYTGGDQMQRFFSRTLAWGVHTGNGRCALNDNENDLYPVRLDRTSLRPGTVYADPYGHILVLTQFVPAREGRPGILFAVDGQPDASITRKRFWEGNFLWNPDPTLGGSGFKAFRPFEWDEREVEVVVPVEPAVEPDPDADPSVGETGGAQAPQSTTRMELRKVLVPLDDKALRRKPGYGDVSSEQGTLSQEAFYDRMEVIISPEGRDPLLALREAVDALAEAARIRVTSVDNAERYLRDNPTQVIEMPWGHSIFETSGAWENYSTPARDLRLLLAIDVVANYEDKVRRAPAAFGLERSEIDTAARRIRVLRERLLEDPMYAITYTRSDGSSWTLSLAELVARAKALETAYNPNDCPELRWGAPKGSAEAVTCKRRAPSDQQKKVAAYRAWFERRQRPARGDPGPEVPGVERPPDEDD